MRALAESRRNADGTDHRSRILSVGRRDGTQVFLDRLVEAQELLQANLVSFSEAGAVAKAESVMSEIWAHVAVAAEDARTAKSARRRAGKIDL